MDMRHAPRELQEAAYAEGVIPYVPKEDEVSVPETEDEEVENIKFPGVQEVKPEPEDDEDDGQMKLF
jgi:hypothetical protein